ncbi:hypothetical protein ACA910_004833 [Epithemia clementina (nom. ined.)]
MTTTTTTAAHLLRAAEITAKCTGTLSILGSLSILYHIWILGGGEGEGQTNLWFVNDSGGGGFQPPQNKEQPKTIDDPFPNINRHECIDIGDSSMYVVGSWAIPRNDHTTMANVFQPRGTTATCRAQGFLFQTFASAIPLYNLSLALFSYLAVNWHWKEAQF